ncbi:MAG TPA: IS66 family transposase, partial [Candidatus Limnocylindrales bacterium]|nr:IS66 family transposase [Candidatus Limnocylindrales bacterium]
AEPGPSPGPRGAPAAAGAREALRQIQQSARTLLEQGQVEETWAFFVAALEAVLVKNRELELLIARLRREHRSTRSERIDPAQLSLLLEALMDQEGPPATIDPEAEARADAELAAEIKRAKQAQPTPPRKPRKPGPGWQTRGAERQEHHIEVPDAERTCADCGRVKRKIGADLTRVLEYVPAHFVEHEYHLDKYACGRCKEGVTTAPGPAKVLDRSAADASLLAHVVVSKYADHTPLHRLSRIYARSGVELPVSTLADWTAGVADLVTPLVDRLAARVLAAYIVRTDATGLRVLDPKSPAHIERGSIWAYVGDDRDVLLRYTKTGEGATGPWDFLAGRTGYIQADASNVFDRLFNGRVASATELGCWAHGRRRLVALQDTDYRVAYPLQLIGRLYRIEHLADLHQLPPGARSELRQERSTPVLDKLKRWFGATHGSEPPSTELRKAADYVLNHWAALTRFVTDGRVSLDNNVCEQQLRDIALGRKNFLFAGSHEAAKRAADLYSLTRTCAQYGVPPLPYFTEVLAKLARGWDTDRLDELLPHRWRLSEIAAPDAPPP